MANECFNSIIAGATNSEWKEIATAFANNQIEWSASLDGIECNEYDMTIQCTTKWSPRPWEEGKMAALSKSYPSVVFYYGASIEAEYHSPSAWFCNGIETKKSGVANCKKQAYQDEVQRFINATKIAADGIDHRVELMPNGRVAADGENRFGECNIFSWSDISEISCGNWHTIGLKKDGTLVACGSDANGQCDVTGISHAVSVSCGRYHTAVLLDSGKVVVLGNLEREASLPRPQGHVALTPIDFPLFEKLKLDKYVNGWEKMNDRIEHVSVGDELTLKTMINTNGILGFEVLNNNGEIIGNLFTGYDESLSKKLTKVKVTVDTVKPLSARGKGAKYAEMTIRLDHISSLKTGNYKQTRVQSWPPVSKIKSIYDAVIGMTDSGEIYVDGFCPCTQGEINSIF